MKRLVDGAALVAILLAIVAVRVVWSSRGEWKAAQATQGDAQLTHLGVGDRLRHRRVQSKVLKVFSVRRSHCRINSRPS